MYYGLARHFILLLLFKQDVLNHRNKNAISKIEIKDVLSCKKMTTFNLEREINLFRVTSLLNS